LVRLVSVDGGFSVPAARETGASVTVQVAVAVAVPDAFRVVEGTSHTFPALSVKWNAARVPFALPVKETVAVLRYVVLVLLSILRDCAVVVLVLTVAPSASVTVTTVVCFIGEWLPDAVPIAPVIVL
jgi:hypothetical protein